MAIIKCKMCGGDLEVTAGVSVAECEFCGTKQTLPKANDDVIRNLFNRANNLRLKCEFDKAEQIYEKILHENDAEAEAHWGIVLCKYGIEYVEDPKTFKRIPTCHRTLFEAVTADPDFLAAVDYSDAAQQAIYESEARAIDRIQKDILAIVKNEKPFDVFICYKESDENGKRTVDSAIANDIYYQLTQEGMKVFYAAITLEDKLGQEYEPYIFAALNSAKVMLVIGTKPEYFSAVWVKNEWSRFLKLMKADRSKLLIPCYRDMDAYDLPEEFAHLQAQDMSKIGFINDVVRGIKKVAVKDEPKTTAVNEPAVSGGSSSTVPLLKRAFMFLEDGDWNSANEYCEKVLDIDPENAQAYLGKLLSELRVRKQEALKDCAEPFDNSNNYQKAVRFADGKLKSALTGYIDHINTRNENARLDGIYTRAKNAMSAANSETAYKNAAQLFESISNYRDSAALAEECHEKAEIEGKDAVLAAAMTKMAGATVSSCEAAIKLLQTIPGWRDADEQIIACQRKIEEIKAKEETERLEKERLAEIARKEAKERAKRKKVIAIIAAPFILAIIAAVIVLNTVIIPNNKYNDAIALMESGNFQKAAEAFDSLGDFNDSKEKRCESYYYYAQSLLEKGQYAEALSIIKTSGIIEDAKDLAPQIQNLLQSVNDYEKYEETYQLAIALVESDPKAAYEVFLEVGDYREASTYKDRISVYITSASTDGAPFETFDYNFSEDGKLLSIRRSYPGNTFTLYDEIIYFDDALQITKIECVKNVRRAGEYSYQSEITYSNFTYVYDGDMLKEFSYDSAEKGYDVHYYDPSLTGPSISTGTTTYSYSNGELQSISVDYEHVQNNKNRIDMSNTIYADELEEKYSSCGKWIESAFYSERNYGITYKNEFNFDCGIDSLDIPAAEFVFGLY